MVMPGDGIKSTVPIDFEHTGSLGHLASISVQRSWRRQQGVVFLLPGNVFNGGEKVDEANTIVSGNKTASFKNRLDRGLKPARHSYIVISIVKI